MRGASEEALRLQRLWSEQKRMPFPGGKAGDARLDEIGLYQSWLGSIAEAAIARAGHLAPGHRQLLAARRAEGNQEIWAAAGDLGEQARAYVARLMAIEDLLLTLPDE